MCSNPNTRLLFPYEHFLLLLLREGGEELTAPLELFLDVVGIDEEEERKELVLVLVDLGHHRHDDAHGHEEAATRDHQKDQQDVLVAR